MLGVFLSLRYSCICRKFTRWESKIKGFAGSVHIGRNAPVLVTRSGNHLNVLIDMTLSRVEKSLI